MSLGLFAGGASGILVTIDGPNASGKTTITAEVARLLREGGDNAVHGARQPSDSPLGTLAREAETTVRGRALACLVAADRHHQLASEIAPALDGDAIVVCDRYIESSLVLQRIDGVELDFILAVNSGILRPDVRVRLVAAVPVLRHRLARRRRDRGRRFEGMPGGSERELALYAEADALLTRTYDLPSILLDTTTNDAVHQAQVVVDAIRKRTKESP